jgi:transglutaminase-like putative cysteine protease
VRSNLVYRASFYIMLSVAAMIVCGDVGNSRLDWALPFVVMAAGVLAFLTVDQNPRLGLPRDAANILALSTLGLLFLEWRSEESEPIRCLGHWTIYLQLVKYSLPKTAEDDWFLFLLGLTQVLIGSVVNQGDMVGAWLLFWALLAVWVLGLFFLQREKRRFQSGAGVVAVTVTGAQGSSTDDPYRGLIDAPYLAATLRVLALTLVLGGLFFLLLPRQAGATRNRPPGSMTRHLTGFDEEVKLGQLGEILENDNVVMSVEFADENREPTRPKGEPLFRGVTLVHYENGSWKQQHRSLQTIVSLKPFRNTSTALRPLLWQFIKLESNDSPTLFAIRPVLELQSTSPLSPYLNPIDGTIFRPEPRGPYNYEVLSDLRPNAPQDNEAAPPEGRLKMLLEVPDRLKERLREIALPQVRELAGEGKEGRIARAQALESYFRESGIFGYTLEMNVVDRTMDPVEDFLVNRKRGHCEYFAAALALLLRSVDIPARVVNGFKGGDWNDLTRSMNVRQKHAHSWVEAYVGNDDRNLPIWITLDPTPSADRDVSVSHVGGFASRLRPLSDMVRYVWVFYVLGYDSTRQNRLLYEPIRYTVREVRRGYATLWYWTKTAFARLFDFQNISSFISIRGFFVSFIVLSLVAFLGRLAGWLMRRLLRLWRGPIDDSAGLTAGILFYRRLAQLLATCDLERTPAETQHEFAVRASRFLSTQGEPTQAVADIPERVVDAFYQVRFGHLELNPGTVNELETQLDLLQSRLAPP